MYMRLAFAVAAHLEPEILLVDEVLAVGDVQFQKKCLGRMGEIAGEGRTILFVSHNMVSLRNLCERGILLESGRIVMDGNIGEVINTYLKTGEEQAGEISWPSPELAPGNEHVRIKAVRIVSDGNITKFVDISREFRIEIDYWNLEACRKIIMSVHLFNAMGVCILTSGNLPSASLNPDPWYDRPYPRGLFRTVCTIPANFLNDGLHSISVYVNASINENLFLLKDILSFNVQDTGEMRKEFMGKWIGAVRPRLDWQTIKLA
jgi:lipopolysaccharide transport system ATP-binding protein